ncbi:hypothetical protein [Argonema galeatum]|uniref:hypothetical protein n=1 Tax=Argonema galeatum TaxID=2942762 RepID=UPI002012E833|nr:hypothetical protein [Argonema galeatum]MCL1462985.1 hypothetical protein [Argonema galeatum A003/A1]
MNVQVLSIEPGKEKGTFNVAISIGDRQHSFTMKGETNIIANKELHAIMGDKDFWEIFKFNQHLAQEVYKLTAKVYNGKDVQLPMAIGEFSTAEVSPAFLQI